MACPNKEKDKVLRTQFAEAKALKENPTQIVVEYIFDGTLSDLVLTKGDNPNILSITKFGNNSYIVSELQQIDQSISSSDILLEE